MAAYVWRNLDPKTGLRKKRQKRGASRKTDALDDETMEKLAVGPRRTNSCNLADFEGTGSDGNICQDDSTADQVAETATSEAR